MKSKTREYCISVLQVDIRVLQRSGILVPGRNCVLRWDATTTAQITTLGGTVRVDLRLEHGRLAEEVAITYTNAGFGSRGWWTCPTCGRRCAVLFLQHRLACRHCSNLHYSTQSAGPRRRALLKANKLAVLYGADPDFPRRPKYMRQVKFERKMREVERALLAAFPSAGNPL